MAEEHGRLKLIIEKGSEIAGGIYGTALGLLFAGPVGALGGALMGPIVTELFKRIGGEMAERFLSKREEIRVGATIGLAFSKIESEIQKGKALRNDEFNQTGIDGSRSGAEAILEGTLLKSRSEYEEKKIPFYANFLANMNLDSSISFETGNTLLRIIEQISYRQISILAYCESVESIDTDKWAVSFLRNQMLGKYQDLYSEIMDLYNKQLLQQAGIEGLGMTAKSMKLSQLGKLFYSLLNLEMVNVEDKRLIQSSIDAINKEKM